MTDHLQITSVQNQRVKRMVALQQKSSERRKDGLFVVEGRRELRHCIETGYEVESVYLCPEVLREYESDEPLPTIPQGTIVYEVTSEVYEKMAYRGGTEGIMAAVRCRTQTLDGLHLPDRPLVVVLESVEKPGNVGAILRSADAAGVDAVIVCDPRSDLYNPNLIRSSVGAFFSVPCVACRSDECIDFLKRHSIQILTAQLQDSALYYDTNMRIGTAIVMGTESTGLTTQWREAADAHIRIPMLGRVDSLNVSVSAAVLMYEAVRQRKGLPRTPSEGGGH